MTLANKSGHAKVRIRLGTASSGEELTGTSSSPKNLEQLIPDSHNSTNVLLLLNESLVVKYSPLLS